WTGGMLSREVGKGDTCPLGGTLRAVLSSPLTANASLDVSFAASCAGGVGILSLFGGTLSTAGSGSDTTPPGAGMQFTHPNISAGAEVAFRGARRALHVLRATGPTILKAVAPTDPAPEIPGATITSIDLTTRSSDTNRIAFLANFAGSSDGTG